MFKASPRSQHLLQYVVEKSLDGEFDLLKERLIGTELFGRPSGYDTGEDAIVRVAASDVRKRLLQFYGSGSAHGRTRIDLPPGSYLPLFCVNDTNFEEPAKPLAARDAGSLAGEPTAVLPAAGGGRKRARMAVALGAVLAVILGIWLLFRPSPATVSGPTTLPWSALFPKVGLDTEIILSDTNISALQFLLDFRLPLADYANRRYTAGIDRPLSPEMQRVARGFTGADYTAATATVDAVTVLRVSQIAGPYSFRIKVRPARSLQLRDFENDENFILLGSPSSNPWGALFAEQLDFAFDYDKELKTELLRNNHPRSGELPRYVPTALGGATGRTFGIVGFIRNPNHAGHILMLAGTTAEATEAALKLVANQDTFAAVLQRYRIPASSPPRHFEILLGVDEMAGAPAKSDIVAVHLLAEPAVAR